MQTGVVRESRAPVWNHTFTHHVRKMSSSMRFSLFDRDLASRDDQIGYATLWCVSKIHAVYIRRILQGNVRGSPLDLKPGASTTLTLPLRRPWSERDLDVSDAAVTVRVIVYPAKHGVRTELTWQNWLVTVPARPHLWPSAHCDSFYSVAE
jgi:hypothetical protein